MHRLRCTITTDCQLLFNQMYEKRRFRHSLIQAHKKKLSTEVDLSYAALWPTTNRTAEARAACERVSTQTPGQHIRLVTSPEQPSIEDFTKHESHSV